MGHHADPGHGQLLTHDRGLAGDPDGAEEASDIEVIEHAGGDGERGDHARAPVRHAVGRGLLVVSQCNDLIARLPRKCRRDVLVLARKILVDEQDPHRPSRRFDDLKS